MATLPVIRYPLDPTGVSPDNRVQGEVHTMVSRRQRVVAPLYGAFFTESLVVRDQATNQILTKDVQYFAAELYELPTVRYGKEICAIVIVTDESVSDTVSLTYQALGGEFSTAADAVKQQIEALNLDDRPIAWGSIIAKPSEYPPSHHMHDIGDLFGFEYVVHQLERIRAAIAFGDAASHDQIYQYIDLLKSQLTGDIGDTGGLFADHVDNLENPHQTTAFQVGAYTKQEVDDLLAGAGGPLGDHIADYENPHQVTAAQVGAYSTGQTYSRAEVDLGLVNLQNGIYNTYLLPILTRLGVVETTLTNHLNNGSNPHGVTAGQTGGYTQAQVNTLLANSGGAFQLYEANGYNSFDWTATYDGILHIYTSDEPRAATNLYVNGNLVSRNTKNGGAGYGRIHHDTCAFKVGDHIQFSTNGDWQGAFNFYRRT